MKKSKPIEQVLSDILHNSRDSVVVAFHKHSDQPPAIINPSEEWLDNQDVMNLLHISIRTLHNFRKNGTIPYSRLGQKLYYKRSDIQRILHDNYIMFELRNRKKK